MPTENIKNKQMTLFKTSIIEESFWKGFCSMGSRHDDIYARIQPSNLTVNQWCEENYRPLKEACRRITEGDPLSEELLHYTLEVLLAHKTRERMVDLEIAWYFCLKVATNNWKSVTSPFYNTYRKAQDSVDLHPHLVEIADHDSETEEFMAQIDKRLEQLDWYSRELMKVYAEHNHNATSLSRATNIPRTSINLTIKRVRKFIKDTITYE